MHQVANSDLHEPTARKRVPKATIRKLIESGHYIIRALDGTPITDWKRLFDDYEIDRPAPEPPLLVTSKTTGSRRNHVLIKINDTEYTISQLEHFGDAVVSVSARVICHELFKKSTFHYFRHSAAMITNDNFRSSKEVKTAAQFEVVLGDTFVRLGPEEAVKKGVELLKTTRAYAEAFADAERLKREPELPPVLKVELNPNRERASDALDKAPLQNTIADAFPPT